MDAALVIDKVLWKILLEVNKEYNTVQETSLRKLKEGVKSIYWLSHLQSAQMPKS